MSDPSFRPAGEPPPRRAPTVSREARRVAASAPERRPVTRAESETVGTIRWGAAFLGWLTATGTAVLLTALVVATGTAVGLASSSPSEAAEGAADNAGAIGVGGAVALALVAGISYLAGGYAAGRMARGRGRSQGLAVWIVGLVMMLIAALIGLAAGATYDVLANLDLPRIPLDEGTVTTGGVITLVVVVVAALLGALAGGALAARREPAEVDLR